MIKKMMLAACLTVTVSAFAQTPDASAQGAQNDKKGMYFKVGGSYFIQTAATEFPIVSGQLPNTDIYAADGTTLVSRETNHGSFGEGFRGSLTAGYRFSNCFGVEMGVNYFRGNNKTMVQTVHRLVAAGPTFVDGTAVGRIKALDLSPALVLFLNETSGLEPYTKVGVIVPVYGDLTIETNRTYTNPGGVTKAYAKDVVKPNPTIGFMAAVGTSYKLTEKLSAFAEIEYRNFTVSGKTKETEIYTENGVDRLHTPTAFRPDASYSASHVTYVDQINSSSNSPLINPDTSTSYTGDTTRPNDAMNEISSFVGISGLGLTLGLKYSL
ncbi:outer membrane beta-barrel protein [Flavobacterium amniphilum]|uniref:outer membrane beta-barrel protein n=1 Tax=Flavobacterium amniphilum TaxID=1834035 RepID=UPI002029D763|nr:outer membrane beta-barrel protein [Flavobacterium amniphilum]MCL9804939.1 outer membrane beta-barrel protein [Flavobacterium amniphilum]